jgi:hypothetical protein
MYNNCYNKAINSHILQKKRYLNILANKSNNVYSCEIDSFSKEGVSFQSRGLNQVLAFPCFCREHDDKVFKKIEKKGIDFTDWSSLHLLCYRTGLSELRKKEIIIKWYEFLERDKELTFLFDRDKVAELIRQQRLGIRDTNRIVSDLITDMNNKEETNFKHFYKTINHTQICISTCFNYETTLDQHYRLEITGKEYDYLSPIFIHLIPINKYQDTLVISYETQMEVKVKSYLKYLFEGSNQEALKQISDLLFLQTENWICSYDFFDKNIRSRKDYVEFLISQNVAILDEKKPLSFNIFEI